MLGSKACSSDLTSSALPDTDKAEYSDFIQSIFSIPGENFFALAAQRLAKFLQVKYVLITECSDKPATRVQTLAFWQQDKMEANFSYRLSDTPCEKVFEGIVCYYPDNIQNLFPDDQDLIDLDAVGYIAAPIFGGDQSVIGHIVAMDSKPIEVDEEVKPVLQTFAIRTAWEIEQSGYINLVNALSSGYHLPLGGDFFRQLTKNIGDILDVDFAVMGRFNGFEENKIESLAIYHRGEFLDSLSYPLDNSPCETVVGKKSEVYATEVQQQFPEFELLKTLGADGYAGTPLFDSNGQPIGLLAVLHQKPLAHPERTKTILEVFGIRASLELERSSQEERIRLYDGILSTTDDLLSLVDRNYIYKAVSQSYSRVFKKPVEKIVGKSVLDLHGSDAFYNKLKRSLDQTLDGETMNLEFWRQLDDGSNRCILGQHKPFYNDQGDIVGIVVAARDITELKQIQADLAISERRLQSLYDDTPTMFFTIDKSSVIVSVNVYGAREIGYQVNELLGRSFGDLVLADDRSIVDEQISNCFSEPGQVFDWEVRKAHKKGKIIWVKESARVVTNQHDEMQLLIVSEDITEKHQLAEELSYQATHDALTQLLNRTEFERQINLVINSANGDEHALFYLDLDRFKIINDACGHLAGDDLLKNIAKFLKQTVSSDDVLARLGGDEFGILLNNCSLEQAAETAEEIRQLIENFQFIRDGRTYQVGVSIGIVAILPKDNSLDEIMSRVDAACYLAKDYGRNRVHVYTENDADIERHRGEMGWVRRIREAIDQDKFELHAQKITKINVGHTNQTCCELLIRLVEDGSVILPGAFLPAAERFGLATQIDEWVVSKAIDWLAQEQNSKEDLSYCSINLSGYSLSNDEFLDFVLEKLSASNIPCHTICFEVTETAAVANLSSAIRFIQSVKSKGCSFSLDDFGSGVSSFTYLKNLPVDYVKIDGSFVKDIATDPIDFAMVRSINEIAQLMGKKTIAEFVENEEILEQLRSIGVDYAQGFGIGKPEKITY